MSIELSQGKERGILHQLIHTARRFQLERRLAFVLLIAVVASGTATFVALTTDLPIAAKPSVIRLLLVADLVLLLAFSVLIARRLVIIWTERKRGLAGSRLHGKLVALFGLVAVTPTIIVAIFSVMLFDFGLKVWFSERVSTAIQNSLAVAEAYMDEHLETISTDALAIAQAINRSGPTLLYSPLLLNQLLTQQAEQRTLTEAAVYDRSGRVLGRASNFLFAFNPQLPNWAMRRAQQGELVILGTEDEDRVRALVRLDPYRDAYLYVGRLVDPRVLGHLDRTEGAVQLYKELEGDRDQMQITFALIFLVVALMLLMAAVWVGLTLANHLTVPIGNLILAAERVGSGDLSARVSNPGGADELGKLSRAFNRMTEELEVHQRELVEANQQLDYRSRFIEAVLGGVSAGVIGLDDQGRITLPNRSACELLGMSVGNLRGRPLAEVAPEMSDLLQTALKRPHRLAERSLTLVQTDGSQRVLLVRIAAEVDQGDIIGYVVTFDDITELLSAQRKAAWSDIARRIAHEIKNPLTPIQLSAERLRRRYLKQISEDPQTFEMCTDTIVRHVEDIGRMVDEFSSFARMPAPVMGDEDLRRIVREGVHLQRAARSDIAYEFDCPEEPVVCICDGKQILRALTNILLNASEAIDTRRQTVPEDARPGEVKIRLIEEAGEVAIVVSDNGKGLPPAEIHRLTEPYVTTRERGTGLGLAIVKKIMEEHEGRLVLENGPEGGAQITLVLPARDDAEVAMPAPAREASGSATA